jgi:flavin reductase (DIM6/NTAB) family NADH-FMN oxidoreductase RutF
MVFGKRWYNLQMMKKSDPLKKKYSKKSEVFAQPLEKKSFKPGNMLYPLPAVMVSCQDANGISNIITVAWTGIIATEPPLCYISVRPERHSFEMIRQSKVFVINLVNKPLAFAADWCGVKSGRDVNKFKEMALTPLPAEKIKAPIIGESPVNLECLVKEVRPMGSHHFFLAEIIHVQVSSHLLSAKTGKFHLEHAELISYCHGKYYEQGSPLGHFGFSVKKKKK